MATENSRLLPPSPDSVEKGIFHDTDLYEDGFVFNRYQSFAGICLYISIVGTTYAYSIYSSLLEENLGFSDQDLYIIASVGNTGLYMSIVGGIILEYCGVHFTVGLGAFLICLGFLYIYLAITSTVYASMLTVSIAYFLSQFGVSCHISSAVTMTVRLFPREMRGTAVGLTKGYFALSSAVLGDLAAGYFSSAHTYFILFIAFAIPTMSMVGVSFVNELPTPMIPIEFDIKNGTPTSLAPFFQHWASLFTVILVFGFSMYHFTVPLIWKFCVSTLVSLLVLSMIAIVPTFYGPRIVPKIVSVVGYKAGGGSSQRSKRSGSNASSIASSSIASSIDSLGSSMHNNTSNCQTPVKKSNNHNEKHSSYNPFNDSGQSDSVALMRTVSSDSSDSYGSSTSTASSLEAVLDLCYYGHSIPLKDSIKTWRFWAIYVTFMVLCGTALMVIDNVNDISSAVGGSPSPFFVTCVSLSNGLGRITAGYMSDLLAHRFSRLQMMAFVSLLMALAQGCFAVGSSTLLYPCLLVVGYLFGCTVALIAVTVPDIFGGKYIATNFGAVDSAPIFGSFLFVTGVVSAFYYTNTVDAEGEATCVGAGCFRNDFIVNATACAVVGLVMLFTHSRTPIPLGTSSH